MSPEERRLARHALGLREGRRQSYRNRYAAALGGNEFDLWAGMANRALAVCTGVGVALAHFALTPEGAALVIDPGEMLDREDFPPLPAAPGVPDHG